MALKHSFNSVVADEVSPGDRVQPSHWNADHVLSNFMRATYASGSGLPTGAGFDVRNSGAQGLWYVQLTDEDGNFTIQRRDPSASGVVTGTPLKIVRDTGVATFEQIALPSYSNVKTTLDTLSARARRPWHTGTVAFSLSGSATVSSSSNATKGGVVRPDQDIDVDTVVFPFTAAALTDRYQVSIHEATPTFTSGVVTGVTIGSALGVSGPVAPQYITTIDNGRAAFSTPVNLTAGTYYAVLITRTDGTGTDAAKLVTVTPTASLVPQVPIGPGKGFLGALLAALNSTPASGATISTGAGQFIFTLQGRFR